MSREKIEIRTQDGVCPATVLRPDGTAPLPAAIFFMDGLGIRPSIVDMAERVAKAGYVVLLPDLFYRAGPYAPLNPQAVLGPGGSREVLEKLMGTTNNVKAGKEDTAHFLAYLDTRKDVAGRKVGTTGYCMGGGVSLTAAGSYPDRIAAAASFHGGRLATDAPTSPHTFAVKAKAEVWVAGADKDKGYPPEMQQRLDKALTEAGVRHHCEIWPGVLHGWTQTDFPTNIYNKEADERHLRELTALYARNLN